eukprot:11171256-Lingulodinium_polyedra.AAC.1
MLRAKGSECEHLVPVLTQTSMELNAGSETDNRRCDLLTALADFGALMDSSPMVPNSEVSAAAHSLTSTAQ